MRQIPLVNLQAQYQKIRSEILSVTDEVFSKGAFIQGEYLETFESQFNSMLGASSGVGVSNGTSAISLALEALGVGVGDEVIVPSHTFFSTAEAVCNVGAKPVFAEILEDEYTIDPNSIRSLLSPRTKAIIPVHLYGNICRMSEILEISEKHSLFVIEDTAQAHFAQTNKRMAGTFGDVGTFSFYPGKNLGAGGDAGFVSCRDQKIADRIRKLANHGRVQKYEHDEIGYNHRMDGLQAAILSVKLKYILEWTAKRQSKAKLYDSLLGERGFSSMRVPQDSSAVYHLYVLRVSNRAEVMEFLKEKGIGVGVHYPIPLHLQPALKAYQSASMNLQLTENLAGEIISLPLCPDTEDSEIEIVAKEFLKVAQPSQTMHRSRTRSAIGERDHHHLQSSSFN